MKGGAHAEYRRSGQRELQSQPLRSGPQQTVDPAFQDPAPHNLPLQANDKEVQ